MTPIALFTLRLVTAVFVAALFAFLAILLLRREEIGGAVFVACLGLAGFLTPFFVAWTHRATGRERNLSRARRS